MFSELFAQNPDTTNYVKDSLYLSGNLMKGNSINPLSPAKAAFYSAVLPGLGQIYNKQYWKVPIVWGTIGAGLYFYSQNTSEYNKYRDAYFNRQKGLPDEFPQYTDAVLIDAQEYYRKQRETSLMLTVLAYFLNIIDANVSAHLKQWNVNDNLSIRTISIPVDNKKEVPGLGFSFRF